MIADAVPVVWPASAPANAGAHRLGWWIGGQRDGDKAFDTLATAADVPVGLIDRLLSGAVEPSGPAAAGIERVTGGAVRWSDWSLPAEAGWSERPTARGDRP